MPETNNSNIIKHNRVKNPNWPEADQLAIYKHGPGFELGTTTNKSSLRSGRDLNSGPLNGKSRAELFKAELRQPRVSARFEFKFESLKSISVLILFVYKLVIESSKYNRENYPRKCFWTQEGETQVKFNPGLSANRPSNNWAQRSNHSAKLPRSRWPPEQNKNNNTL